MPLGDARSLFGFPREQQAIHCTVDAESVGQGFGHRAGVGSCRAGKPLSRLVRQFEASGDRFDASWVARAVAPPADAGRRARYPRLSASMSARRSLSRSASISGRTGFRMPRSKHDPNGCRGVRQARSLSSSSAMRSRDRAMRSLARAVHASSAAASGSPGAEAGVETEEAEDSRDDPRRCASAGRR